MKTNNQNTNEIIDLFIRSGLIANDKIADKNIRAKQQEKQQKVYHNTELLLKQYRNLVWMMDNFPDTIAEELDKPFEKFDDMIDRLDLEMSIGNKKIQNKLAGLEKTRLLIDRINDALTVLKKKPDDGETLYSLIYMSYISPEVLNHNELLFRLSISSRQYYRLREKAISVLSLCLWNSNDKDLDLWLNVIEMLKD